MNPERRDVRELMREFFNLNHYESVVYIYLIERGRALVRDIARETKIPNTKIYSVIKSLRDKGLIKVYRDRYLEAEIIDPEKMVRSYVDKRYRELQESSRKIMETIISIKYSQSKSVSRGEKIDVSILSTYRDFKDALLSDFPLIRSRILVVVSKRPIEIEWREIAIELVKLLIANREISFVYITPPKSKGASIIKDLVRKICETPKDLVLSILKELLGIRDLSLSFEDLLNTLSRIELYELEFDISLILIDNSISYNIFTDPVNNRFLFAVRYESESYSRVLNEYVTMHLTASRAMDQIRELYRSCF